MQHLALCLLIAYPFVDAFKGTTPQEELQKEFVPHTGKSLNEFSDTKGSVHKLHCPLRW